MMGGDVHWGGDDSRPTSLHGNGAASFARTSMDWAEVTCTLCHSLRPGECICPYTSPETWLSAASCGYGSGYEPGSMQEWDPDCPAHPPIHGQPDPTPTPDARGGAL